MKNKLILYGTALLVFTGDLFVKGATAGKEQILIDGLLALRTCKNTGISFGLFSGNSTAILILTAAVLAAMILFAHLKLKRPFPHFAFGLMIGGAAGNLFDRAVFGFVRDMFEFLFVDFSVFNLADCAVVCGAALIIGRLLFGKDN